MKESYIHNDLGIALAGFQRTADQIVDSLRKSVEMRPSQSLIYHYTDDIGLKGIIESGQLWLSDIFSLSDPSELSHGLSHAAKILNSKTENGPTDAKAFSEKFANFCKDGVQESAHYFVCSFSYDDDDLGQWRAYADNGHGYALGFDAQILVDVLVRNEADSDIRNIRTFPLAYDDTELVDINRQLIESTLPLISLPSTKALSSRQINNYLRDLSINLSLYSLEAALYFKHKAYENEKEFRFLQISRSNIPAPNVKWRHQPYELVKYIEFDWRSLRPGALKRIVVGPAADQYKATRFVNDCLKAFHTGDVEVTRSEIPYRAVPT